MTDYSQLSAFLTDTLALEIPPVALRFVSQAPEGIQRFEGEVPSACTFWRRAEQGMFYADASSHFNCLIGAHAMGLPMPPERQQDLMSLIGEMNAARYVQLDEVPHIPTASGAKSGIIYGPLTAFVEAPDAVLVWITPSQSMLLQEATEASRWSDGQPGIPTFGRPSCAAIPMALRRGASTLSMGCMGMRIFTDISDGHLLGVLPKPLLARLPEALERVTRSNQQMGEHYRGQKAIHTRDVARVQQAKAERPQD